MQPLHTTEFGVFVGKHSERVVLRKGGQTLSEHLLLPVEQILVSGRGISVSTGLIEACAAPASRWPSSLWAGSRTRGWRRQR